jgi:hypothetical protein
VTHDTQLGRTRTPCVLNRISSTCSLRMVHRVPNYLSLFVYSPTVPLLSPYSRVPANMAFLYKRGYFPTLDLEDISNVLLLSATKMNTNEYIMYLMIGDDVVFEIMPEGRWKRKSLFERFCTKVEEEVVKVMAGLKKDRVSVEKEGWVIEG